MSTKRYVIEANEELVKSLMESGAMRLIETEGEPDMWGYPALSNDGVDALRDQGYSIYVSRAPHELGTLFEVEKDGKELKVIKKYPKLGGTYHVVVKVTFGEKLSKTTYASLKDAINAGLANE